jgi:carbamoyl-phosphate synthase large subunit
MILGGGPNRIGQGIEFDYCCVHASFALRAAGFETVMVNSNPETVSTDYDTSDRLYFEPLTLEDVLHIYRHEGCDGGDRAVRWADPAESGGGAGEEWREYHRDASGRYRGGRGSQIFPGVGHEARDCPAARMVWQPAWRKPRSSPVKSGIPVLMRPSFVLGGRAMVIVYNDEMLRKYMTEAVEVSEDRPVLIDRYLEDAVEVDVDCISDGETSVIGAIMEHVELAGIHSGDSACTIPRRRLSDAVKDTIRKHTFAFAKALHVRGLMNVQYAVHEDTVYVLEVNPRASRTVPFVSKAIGVPLAKLAALVMAGYKLKDLGFTKEVVPKHYSVKEAVFPFVRFPGIDVILTPGDEVHGRGYGDGSHQRDGLSEEPDGVPGTGCRKAGPIFVSVRDHDKKALEELGPRLEKLGYTIYATLGTSTALREKGIASQALFRISDGRPNVDRSDRGEGRGLDYQYAIEWAGAAHGRDPDAVACRDPRDSDHNNGGWSAGRREWAWRRYRGTRVSMFAVCRNIIAGCPGCGYRKRQNVSNSMSRDWKALREKTRISGVGGWHDLPGNFGSVPPAIKSVRWCLIRG